MKKTLVAIGEFTAGMAILLAILAAGLVFALVPGLSSCGGEDPRTGLPNPSERR